MNQAVVPGGPTSVNPGHETGGYGECQVPSPSQWSDPCYSPPSFHSPQHLPVELEKVKEEPFSPPSSNGGSPTYIPSAPSAILTSGALHHGVSPYGRPSTGGSHVIKKDAYESCINLSDLLSENQNLIQQHNSPPPASASPPYGATYPDHPLLRGRLEDASGVFQLKKISPSPTNAGGSPSPLPLEPSPTSTALHLLQPSHHALEDPQGFYAKISASPASSTASSSCDEGLNFLESLVDVKRELEDDVGVGSSCGSPAAPSPGGAGGQQRDVGASQQVSCQRDILETVEILAQEHNMRDVQRVSDSLNIPLDPAQWSVEDVRSWLKLQASQLNLPPLMLDFWNYGGPSLLKLTEQQFRQLAPIGGELLYAKLEIWREALKSSPKLSSSSPDPRIPYIFLQHQAHHLQSPHHQGGLLGHQEPAAQMLLTHHNLHLHQLQQQHQQQQLGLPSGGSSPSGSSMPGSAPSSPPLPMSSSLAQVPTPVAQVSQQSSVSPAPSSPQQGGGTAAASAVYLDEPCLDMAALLQQQQQQQPPAVSPTGSPHGAHNTPPPHCPQEDAYDSEDEVEEETCSNTGGGGGGGSTGRGGTHIHLWQFLKELLQQPQLYGSCIRWLDRQKGVFKIEDSVRVARLWGKRKNRPAMNYDKLSRSIRQYYKKGIMKKTERSQRLVYQFCHPYSL